MAFSVNSGGNSSKADMNVVPLIDILLVLLIIFMVTAPATSYQIQVDLPQKSNDPPPPEKNPPDPIRLRIDAGGVVTWNGSAMTMSELAIQFQAEADREVQARLEIETVMEAQYETLAQVLARAKNANMEKIAFVDNM